MLKRLGIQKVIPLQPYGLLRQATRRLQPPREIPCSGHSGFIRNRFKKKPLRLFFSAYGDIAVLFTKQKRNRFAYKRRNACRYASQNPLFSLSRIKYMSGVATWPQRSQILMPRREIPLGAPSL